MSIYSKIVSICLAGLIINGVHANYQVNNNATVTIFSSNIQSDDASSKGGILQFNYGDTILDNNITLVVGEKNDDTLYTPNQYAKLLIDNNVNLLLRNGSTLKVQQDGLLCNRGNIILNNDSSLILSPSTALCNNGFIKSGLDNQDGTIVVNSGSNIYWENNGDRTYTTIHNGTIDFSNCLSENHANADNNLKIKLKNVKVKLNDYNINFVNTDVLKNVCIEENCELICNSVNPNINKIKNLFNNNSEDFVNIK